MWSYNQHVPDPLAVALEAAIAAGDLLREMWPHDREVRLKGPRDIVTDADIAAQDAIAGIVRARFPEHHFLAEEGRHDISLDGPTPVWIVDPLDGTTNYARHLPNFCVAIGLARDGLAQVGAVYDPLRRELFYAERGGGAFVRRGADEEQALSVSAVPALAEAVAGADWAHEPALRDQALQALLRVAPACRTVRAFGSAALGLAYVAAGRLDAYYHLALQPWDVAAASLLITEAGGTLTRPDGQPWRLGHRQVAASNGALHAAFVDRLGLGTPAPPA